jgi:putative ABC transport system substrate-binding protein
MRRIGALMNLAENDPEGQARNAAFLQGLQQLGWTDGRNVRIEYRWTLGDADRIRKYAAELVALEPDVVFTFGGATTGPLQQVTRTVPLVFAGIIDPVDSGLVASLARPAATRQAFSGSNTG